MNIHNEIEKIKQKYNLNIRGVFYADAIRNVVKQILDELPLDKKIGIRGAGEHTKEMLRLINDDVQIIGVFDRRCLKNREEIYANRTVTIYSDEKIADMDVDIMIISSYSHRKAMKAELEQYAGKFDIVDIYDELRKYDFDVNFAFYQPEEDMYENVLYYRSQYNQEPNADTLKNLLVSYLNICDLINYKKYSEEYISKAYQNWKKIEAALEETEYLFASIKKNIKARKHKDILMFWNDQMGYADMQKTHYMKKKAEKSFFFENSYAVSPFTHASFLAMFRHLRSIDDVIYGGEDIGLCTENNSDVFRLLDGNGYDFRYIGNFYNSNYFERSQSIVRGLYSSSNFHMIALLQELLDNPKPVFALIHICEETHNPYLSGELDDGKWYEWPLFAGDSEETALRQMEKSLLYWDKQLNYYTNFLHDNSIQIYMSDHGKRYNCQPTYKDATMHTTFFIVGKNVPVCRNSKMFSLYDLDKVIDAILREDYDETKIFSEYVIMQEMDVFAHTTIAYYMENDSIESSYAFRAIRTKKDLYVKLSNGKRMYYLLPNEDMNLYADERYKERIKELDLLVGDNFVNYKEYEDLLC